MKQKILCLLLFFTAGATLGTTLADARGKSVEKTLQRYIKALSKKPGARVDAVEYTGGFSQEIRGFCWQRGDGDGWTRGERLCLPAADGAVTDSLFHIFERIARGQFAKVNQNRRACDTYFEATRTFYGYRLQDDGTLYVLSATTENEICVPDDWTTRNRYCHPVRNASRYFRTLPKRTQHLLALSRLWSGVRRNFVFMNRVTVNWDSLYAAYIPLMERAKSDNDALRLQQRMVAQVNDGHTYVYGSGSMQSAPFTTVMIGGKVYVDEVLSSELQQRGMQRGMEVVAIDGEEVVPWGTAHVMPYVAASTPQWRQYKTFCGGALTERPQGEKVVVSLRQKDGKLLRLKCTARNDEADLRKADPALTFRMLDDSIGYLRIRNFMDNDVTTAFDRLFPQISRSRALVIDLRNNGGGNSGKGDHILMHLTADSLRCSSWTSPSYVPALASWGFAQTPYSVSGRYLYGRHDITPYTRPIVVLINRGTFSAAEDFTAILQGNGRARLVGEPSGGSTGNGVRLTLQEGVAWANICSKHDIGPGNNPYVGRGLLPDVPAEETYDSYFRAPQTVALATALRLLKR